VNDVAEGMLFLEKDLQFWQERSPFTPSIHPQKKVTNSRERGFTNLKVRINMIQLARVFLNEETE
jgi:hypothetical protein